MAFNSLPTLLSRPEWVDQVIAIVLENLADHRVEVRDKARVALGGFLHCELINKKKKEELLVNIHDAMGSSVFRVLYLTSSASAHTRKPSSRGPKRS